MARSLEQISNSWKFIYIYGTCDFVLHMGGFLLLYSYCLDIKSISDPQIGGLKFFWSLHKSNLQLKFSSDFVSFSILRCFTLMLFNVSDSLWGLAFQAVKSLAKSPLFARDPRHLQFEADINRLLLYTRSASFCDLILKWDLPFGGWFMVIKH